MHRSRKVVGKGLALLLVLAALSTLGSASVWGQAAGEVWIRPGAHAGQTIVVPTGEVGVIRYGWIAAHRWLVQMAFWVSGHEFVLTRDDIPGWSKTITKLDVLRYLNPVERTPQFDGDCFGNRAMGGFIEYPLTDLEPGLYTLHSRWWLDYPITDGCDPDGDGRPTIIQGTVFDTVLWIDVQGE